MVYPSGGMGEDRTTPRVGQDPTTNQQRLTVHEAARQLGISEDAIRMRVKRGTLAADKEGGRLYVLLDSDPTTDPTIDRTEELLEELRERVRYLERQVEEERDARRRADTLLARLMDRVPELEAPTEPQESRESAGEDPGSTVPPQEQEEPTSRPWWRRWFG